MITAPDRRKNQEHRRRAPLAVPAAAAGLAAASAVAALAACSSSSSSSTSAPSSSAPSSSAPTSSAAAGVSASAGGASASGAAGGTAEGLKTASIGGVTVLTNAQGFALYSFAPDTATKSACSGACAAAWPPVKAPATVKSPYTALTRSGGATQLVFNGHPLYTYLGDTSPGTANGNGISAFGGLWHEVPASGGAAPSPTSTTITGY